jgi:predicted phosphodiesterase
MASELSILQELKQVVKQATLGTGTISWVKVERVMNGRYPDLSRNRNGWRMLYRNNFDEKYKVTSLKADYKYTDKKYGRYEVNERIINQLKKKKELHFLANLFGFTDEEFMVELTKLKLNGYNGITIWNDNGTVFVQNMYNKQTNDEREYTVKVNKEIKIGVVTDTHLGSTNEGLKELNNFYDYCQSLGIKTVLHDGDVTDGYYLHKRPESVHEQHSIGFNEQLDYVVKNYPKRKSITTYFIIGNHDDSFLRFGSANIGEIIPLARKDMIYLGHNHAFFKINDKVKISMIHPNDGSSRTLSYSIQKVIDYNKSRNGDIMLLGHYHHTAMVFYKGVYGFMLPSFQHQTNFQVNNNLAADVGGCILTIKLNDDDTLKTVTCEWVMYKQY